MYVLGQLLNLLLTAMFSLVMLLSAHMFMNHRSARDVPVPAAYRTTSS
jgi:hypothetical protein